MLTAAEATARLGVKPETLYAYVSRGLLRTGPGPDGRSRLYARDDVERLYARSRARRGHGAAAAGALRWGEPVLESAITEIDASHLCYRGVPATELAARRLGFEAVAEFLWTGVLPNAPVRWEAPPSGLLGGEGAHGRWLAALRDASLARDAGSPWRPSGGRETAPRTGSPRRERGGGGTASASDSPRRERGGGTASASDSPRRERGGGGMASASASPRQAPVAGTAPPLTAGLMAYGVASFALHDVGGPGGADETLLDGTLARARRLIGFLAGVTAPRSRREAAPTVAAALLRSLGGRQDRTLDAEARAVQAVDLALVLCADHELNASTFAARVAASTGADLSACVLAALGTLSGPRHGGACNEVEAFLAALPNGTRLPAFVNARLRNGQPLPGFGHQLYPEGDPRCPPLLVAALELAPTSAMMRKIRDLIQAVGDAGGEPPSVDLGLVAVAQALGLGGGGALALFALGRTAGWTAHVIEQRQQGFLLRPRAKYVGRRG